MPKRGIDYILDVFEYIRMNGIENEVDIKTLNNAIQLNVGFTHAIINKYFTSMKNLNLIQPLGEGKFKINWDEIERIKKSIKNKSE